MWWWWDHRWGLTSYLCLFASDILYPKDSSSPHSGMPAEVLCRGRDFVVSIDVLAAGSRVEGEHPKQAGSCSRQVIVCRPHCGAPVGAFSSSGHSGLNLCGVHVVEWCRTKLTVVADLSWVKVVIND